MTAMKQLVAAAMKDGALGFPGRNRPTISSKGVAKDNYFDLLKTDFRIVGNCLTIEP
jgi:hypothetical protein